MADSMNWLSLLCFRFHSVPLHSSLVTQLSSHSFESRCSAFCPVPWFQDSLHDKRLRVNIKGLFCRSTAWHSFFMRFDLFYERNENHRNRREKTTQVSSDRKREEIHDRQTKREKQHETSPSDIKEKYSVGKQFFLMSIKVSSFDFSSTSFSLNLRCIWMQMLAAEKRERTFLFLNSSLLELFGGISLPPLLSSLIVVAQTLTTGEKMILQKGKWGNEQKTAAIEKKRRQNRSKAHVMMRLTLRDSTNSSVHKVLLSFFYTFLPFLSLKPSSYHQGY